MQADADRSLMQPLGQRLDRFHFAAPQEKIDEVFLCFVFLCVVPLPDHGIYRFIATPVEQSACCSHASRKERTIQFLSKKLSRGIPFEVGGNVYKVPDNKILVCRSRPSADSLQRAFGILLHQALGLLWAVVMAGSDSIDQHLLLALFLKLLPPS